MWGSLRGSKQQPSVRRSERCGEVRDQGRYQIKEGIKSRGRERWRGGVQDSLRRGERCGKASRCECAEVKEMRKGKM